MCPKESNITTRSIPHIHTLRTDFFFPIAKTEEYSTCLTEIQVTASS